MSWIKTFSVDTMLKYGVDYYTFLYEDDQPPYTCAIGPASVYLFGEHADYNRAKAMAITVPLMVMVLIGYNDRKEVNIATEASCGEELKETYPLDEFEKFTDEAPTWAKITLWILTTFKDKIEVGLNIAYVSSIPIGIGLGSSTAMAGACFTAVESLIGRFLRYRPKLKICREIEMSGSDTPTGYAQPMAVFGGEPSYALVIDCRTLIGSYLSLKDIPVVFLITYSGNKRIVSETPFRERMLECEKAASLLGVKNLSYATSELLRVKRGVLNETLHKRAVHVVGETLRIHEANLAMKERDFVTFGLKMLQSHSSLRDNFEVSNEDLDNLVAIAMACEGVYGSKLAGIGFGGCTITMVKKENLENLIDTLSINYSGECSFLIAQPWGCSTELTFELNEYLCKIEKANKHVQNEVAVTKKERALHCEKCNKILKSKIRQVKDDLDKEKEEKKLQEQQQQKQ